MKRPNNHPAKNQLNIYNLFIKGLLAIDITNYAA